MKLDKGCDFESTSLIFGLYSNNIYSHTCMFFSLQTICHYTHIHVGEFPKKISPKVIKTIFAETGTAGFERNDDNTHHLYSDQRLSLNVNIFIYPKSVISRSACGRTFFLLRRRWQLTQQAIIHNHKHITAAFFVNQIYFVNAFRNSSTPHFFGNKCEKILETSIETSCAKSSFLFFPLLSLTLSFQTKKNRNLNEKRHILLKDSV